MNINSHIDIIKFKIVENVGSTLGKEASGSMVQIILLSLVDKLLTRLEEFGDVTAIEPVISVDVLERRNPENGLCVYGQSVMDGVLVSEINSMIEKNMSDSNTTDFADEFHRACYTLGTNIARHGKFLKGSLVNHLTGESIIDDGTPEQMFLSVVSVEGSNDPVGIHDSEIRFSIHVKGSDGARASMECYVEADDYFMTMNIWAVTPDREKHRFVFGIEENGTEVDQDACKDYYNESIDRRISFCSEKESDQFMLSDCPNRKDYVSYYMCDFILDGILSGSVGSRGMLN